MVSVQVRLVLWRFSLWGLVLVLFWFSEALAVERLPCHLHHGLDLRVHVQDASLAPPLLALGEYNTDCTFRQSFTK